MRRSIGLLGILLAAAIGGYLYMQQAKSVSQNEEAGNPRATVDIVGVKMDLLSMAQAERAYRAREGHYASLDDLRASGDLLQKSGRRGFYSYSADTSDAGFTITATYSGPPNPQAAPTLTIDQNMEVH